MTKIFRFILLAILLAFGTNAFSASYTLPADIISGTGAFSGCSGSSGVYTCSSTVSLGNNDTVTLSGDVTLIITGNFNLSKNVTIDSGIYALDIQVIGSVTMANGTTIKANITATGDIDLGDTYDYTGDLNADGGITLGKNGSFTGSIVAGGVISLDKNSTITADITAGGDININTSNIIIGDIVSGGNIDIANNNGITGDVTANGGTLDIGKNSSVNGICTPFHPNCIGGGSLLDHFRIIPATTNASTCLANAITIIAEDAANNPITDYANQINITTSASHGNWSINNADNTLLPVFDNNDDGAVNYTFVVSDLGEIVLNLSNTHAETLTITVSDSTAGISSTSIPIIFNRNAFVITEDTIQIAGRPQSMVVEMWVDDAAASPSCAIDTNYNSNAQVLQASIDRFTVLTGADDPTINTVVIPDTPASAAITLDFSATPGSATFGLDSTDVGQYALTLEDTTLVHSQSVISGSSSLLTVRPFGLAVTNVIAGITTNPEGTAFDDPVFTSAGSNFSATVAGVLWSAADDTEVGGGDGIIDTGTYVDNLIAPSYAWDTSLSALTTGGFTPAGGVVGTLNNGNLLSTEFVDGSFVVSDLQYTEVGSFTLQSSATGFLGVLGVDIVGHDIIVGRFTPAYFAIAPTNGELANACTTGATAFTYIGESFTYGPIHPSFQVSAMNALNNVTLNYTGADWAKLSDDSVDLTIPTADSTQDGSDGTAPMVITYTQDVSFYNVTETSGGIFNFEFATDEFVYSRDANSEVSEFPSDIDLTITAVTDLEGVTTTSAFTLKPAPVLLRFGRIKMGNVHGSELIDLAMPMIVEYYNAGAYAINGDDTCTTVVTANLDITDNLSTTGASIISVTKDPILLGDLGVTLTAPGAGIDGSIIVTPNLTVVADWLRYEWDTTIGVDPFDDNPWATATFGIYLGNEVNIYQIQTFQ